jgi:hypothetical protein
MEEGQGKNNDDKNNTLYNTNSIFILLMRNLRHRTIKQTAVWTCLSTVFIYLLWEGKGENQD